ncbi:unnamed protein product [Colias eurytheme]|nr:unnamed protein product [Colias eurytheme]
MKWRSDRLIKVRMNTGTLIQLLLSTLVASERKPQAGRGPGGRRAEGRWLGDALADPVPCTGLANGTRLRSVDDEGYPRNIQYVRLIKIVFINLL